MAKNNDYWIKRHESLQQSLLEPTDKYLGELEEAYTEAIKGIEKDIALWYQRFVNNNNIANIAEAKKLLTSKELKELQWDVNQYIKAGKENGITANWAKELENASARVHISRFEAIKIQIQQKIEELYGGREDKVKALLGNLYTEGCYRNAYEIAQRTGADLIFAKIDDNRLHKVLRKPWTVDNRTFSERIWGDRTKLVNTLHNEITKGIITGSSYVNIAKAISNKMGSDLKSAQRLVLTESAFFASEAQKDTYKELNVEEYEIIGTLDHSTCSDCGDMDGKVFKRVDMIVGVNAPPFHPNCRCTTVPYFVSYFNDEFTVNVKRAARDPKTDKTIHINNMSYKEWKEKYIVEKSAESDIIKEIHTESGHNEVHIIGKIDRNIYKCITDDIVTDQVIITDERISHIKERHPNDYERYYEYMRQVIEDPNYIINGNKPNTALILKEFSYGSEQFKTILRLITSNDDTSFKNSIITFMKINNKEWERLLRNKKILYKKE